MTPLVLGIDGGGTHTRAQLADTRGNVLGNGQAGASNPQAAGSFAAAQNEIALAVQRAFADARREQHIVASACFGISGVDRAEERAILTAWGRERIAEHIAITNDGLTVLAAGTPENWGVALIAGTGASAWGRAHDGRTARAGGWGYLIGDEGSGANLGLSALRAATQAADGRGAETQLLALILDFWELREPMDLIARVYRSGLKPADFARLAPLVLRAALAGDPVAERIAQDASASLADAIIAVARRLEFGASPIPLALTGGVLLETDIIRARLLASAQARGYAFAPVELVTAPVRGAVRIAIESVGVKILGTSAVV